MVTTIDKQPACPKCAASWDGGDIFETLRPQEWCQKMSDDELRAYVHAHYSEPYRFSQLIGINVLGKYDGISYWECPACKTRWDRFTQQEVATNASTSSGGKME